MWGGCEHQGEQGSGGSVDQNRVQRGCAGAFLLFFAFFIAQVEGGQHGLTPLLADEHWEADQAGSGPARLDEDRLSSLRKFLFPL